MLIGLTTVLPIYVQGVLGRSPLVAGTTLAALIIGWPLSVTFSGRLYRAFGLRHTLRVGTALFPLGAGFLLFLNPHSSPFVAGVGSFVMGCGMGLLSITSMVTVQDSVEWSMRGSATASLIFARSLGSTIGATAIGALLNIGITYYGTGALATRLHDLLNQPAGLTHLSSDPAVRAVFDQALRWSFVGVVVMAGLTFVATWLIPVTHRSDSAAAATPTAAAQGSQAASH